MIWIGLGANVSGRWGSPAATLLRALSELATRGFLPRLVSPLYRTAAVSCRRQPPFLNAVAGLAGASAPAALLRLVKELERQAGRRANGRHGPRCLDIDVLDHGGRIIGRPGVRRRVGELLLPHPEVAQRGFVLVPLARVAPRWRHPVLGATAAELLKRQPRLARGVSKPLPWPSMAGVGGGRTTGPASPTKPVAGGAGLQSR